MIHILLIVLAEIAIMWLGITLASNRVDVSVVALGAAFLAGWFAYANGIPIWRDWVVGDASDIGTLVFLIICYCKG